MADEAPSLISLTTVLSLLSTVAILGAAYIASVQLLPRTATTKTRILFVWHAFDALIHFILEGSFLYNCFFSSATIESLSIASKTAAVASEFLPPNVHFLGDTTRIYGAAYGTSPFSKLWMEYARADRRWGGSDLTVISLELLTVFIMGPLAVWVCECLRRDRNDAWFWMSIIATSELYGGFLTFAPEWLSGNTNLDGSNFMYLWVYLFFFNMLWVWIPFWILYEAYGSITTAMGAAKVSKATKKRK